MCLGVHHFDLECCWRRFGRPSHASADCKQEKTDDKDAKGVGGYDAADLYGELGFVAEGVGGDWSYAAYWLCRGVVNVDVPESSLVEAIADNCGGCRGRGGWSSGARGVCDGQKQREQDESCLHSAIHV